MLWYCETNDTSATIILSRGIGLLLNTFVRRSHKGLSPQFSERDQQMGKHTTSNLVELYPDINQLDTEVWKRGFKVEETDNVSTLRHCFSPFFIAFFHFSFSFSYLG